MSNLLKDASILLTPTAYDDGSMNAIKPENGDGDFTFSRSSAATRVNAQGLVENVQIISPELVLNGSFSQEGSELITNGDFATDSNWTLASGISYNSNGYIDFDGTQGGGQARNTPNITFVAGKTYKVVYEIKNYVSGTIRFRFQNGVNTVGQQQSGDGVKTEYITCNDSSNNNFQFFNSSTFTGSIDNVSVKEVGQDWTLGSGWSIGDGKVIFNDSSNGDIRTSNNVFTINKKYKIQLTVGDLTSGTAFFGIGDGSAANLVTYDNYANGNYSFEVTAPNGQELRVYATTSSGSSFSITNISVKEITDDTDLPRINYEGFNYQDTLGSELIAGGDFSYDSGWSGQKTIANGQLTKNSGGLVYKAILDVSVKDYKVVVDVDSAGPNLNMYLGGAQQSLSVGVNTIDMQSGGSNSFVGFNNGDGSVINSISVKEVTGQEVVPGSGCGSWLLEPQSSNYSNPVNSSEQPSTWHSSGGVIITANAIASPEGIQNSSLVVNNASSGARYARNLFNFSSGSGLHTVTIGYFIKYYNNQWIRLRSVFFIGSPANGKSTYFDIQNGVIGTSDATHTAKMEDYGNGWYRCSIKFEIDKSSDNNGYVHIEAMDGDNSNTFAANGQGYYAFGSDGEELPFPTSYIPQNGSLITRLQDVANNSGNATLINSTEGVLYAEISALANYNLQRWLSLSDGTTSNTVKIGIANSATDYRFACEVRSGGSTQAFMTYNFGAVEPTFVKIAIKYKENDFALWVNGVEVATDTSGSAPIGLSELAFDRGDGVQKFEGKVKALAVYKEALTDAELQCLTTI